jgi:hypothetical protein
LSQAFVEGILITDHLAQPNANGIRPLFTIEDD